MSTEPQPQPSAAPSRPKAAPAAPERAARTKAAGERPKRERRRRRTYQRLRDPRPHGWVAWALLVLFAAIPLISAVQVLAKGWRPTGDVAAITLRSSDVGRSDTPLIGQPTTSGFYEGGIESSHPGPTEYYLLAAPVRVLGPIVGTVVGAALIVSATLALTLWLAFRHGGTLLMALVAGALAATALGLGSQSLHDGLNSEISTYPYALLVLCVWCVALRDTRILPLTVGVASFLAQVHVSGVRLMIPFTIFVAISLVFDLRRSARRRRHVKPDLIGAAVVAAVMWLPVAIDQLTGSPGNLTSLYRFMQSEPKGIGARLAAERLVTAVGPPPLITKSGWLEFIQVLGPIQVLAAFAVLGFLGSVAVDRWLKRDRPFPMLVLTLGVFALSAVAYTATVPVSGAVRADAFRWMWIVGALVWAAVAWAVVLLLQPRLSERPALLVAPVLAVLAMAMGLGALLSSDLSQEREGPIMPIVGQVSTLIQAKTSPGEYRLVSDGSPWQLETALIVDLEHHGYHVRATRGPRALGKHRAVDATSPQPELGELLIRTTDGGAVPDGATLIATIDVAPPGWQAQQYKIYAKDAP